MISAITGMHTKKALDLNRGQGWQTLSTKLTMYLEQKIGIKWAREGHSSKKEQRDIFWRLVE